MIRTSNIILWNALVLTLCSTAAAQFVQQAGLPVPSGTVTFGYAVAISSDGNTAIVGAPQGNGSIGSAWVYSRVEGVWTQPVQLVGTGSTPTAVSGPNNSTNYFVLQGTSVALSADGNTAIIGGPYDNGLIGAAWVFVRTNGVWSQQNGKLVGAGAVGTSDQGNSVALSADGNTAVIGGYCDNNCKGAIWVFVRSNGFWIQQGEKLTGAEQTFSTSGWAQMGQSVAISADGNTMIAGGPADNDQLGASWVFTRQNGVWGQQGDKLVGSGAQGQASQGGSVALSTDGNTAVVGGPADSGDLGAAWVFVRSNGIWFQESSKLIGSNAVGQSGQGRSVAISGDGQTIVVGGSGDSSSLGAVWVFSNTNGAWSQEGQKLTSNLATPNAQQGYPVAISADGNTLMIGGDADNGYMGEVWAFVRPGATTTTISMPAATVYAGSTITFSCTVAGPPWTGPPMGTVILVDFGTAVPGATAFLNTTGTTNIATTLAPGNHSISCAFASSDGVTLPSTSSTVGLTVVKAPVKVLVNSPQQARIGRAMSISISVAPTVGTAIPTGTVGIQDGSQSIGNLTLVNGQATLSITLTALGTHKIQANYSGDNNFLAGSASAVVQVVTKFSSQLVLSASANAGLYGNAVTFTTAVGSQVPAGMPVPSGQVQFLDGSAKLGAVALSSGVVRLTLANLSAGTHTISAQYAGDDNWSSAQSTPLSYTVSQAGTITSVVVQPGATEGTVAVTVSVKPPGGGTPDGQVIVTDTVDGTTLGTLQLPSDHATVNLSLTAEQLGARMGHAIRAKRPGTKNFAGSTSAATPLPFLVNAAGGAVGGYAPDEIVSLYGSRFAASTDQSTASTLPTTLEGTTVAITDSKQTKRPSGLYMVSPGQVNFVVPSGTATGTASITLTTATGSVLPIQVTIDGTSPGIFTLDGSGRGIPAGQIVRVHPDHSQTIQAISDTPIVIGSDTVSLNLYATGIRHRTHLKNVTCMIAGIAAPVTYVGARGKHPGMDQAIVQLPQALEGKGNAALVLTVDGQPSNSVTVIIQ